MNYKRFLVFAYYNYYPSGGMNDFQKSFDTYEEAEEYIRLERHDHSFDRYDIVDLDC